MKKLLPLFLGAVALAIVAFSPSSASAGVRIGFGWGGWVWGGWGPNIYIGPRYGYWGGYYPYRRYYYGGYYPRPYYGYYPYRRYAYRKWRRRW